MPYASHVFNPLDDSYDWYDDEPDVESEDEESEYPNSDLIRPYDHTYPDTFYACSGTTGEVLESSVGRHIYFGVELEVSSEPERERADALAVLKRFGLSFIELKRDGSLNNGFEIVTQPATYAAHKKLWERFFDGSLPESLGVDSTCGMHVHVSREAFSHEMHLRRLLVFINAPANFDYISAVAGRGSVSYAALRRKRLLDPLTNDKYEAVNTGPRSTIEFRLFRSTLDKDIFFKNLDFVRASIAFTETTTYSHLTQDEFVRFVTKHKDEYRFLHSWHVQHGYAADNKQLKAKRKAA